MLQERKTLSNIRFDVKNLTTSLKAGFDKCKRKWLDMVRKIKIQEKDKQKKVRRKIPDIGSKIKILEENTKQQQVWHRNLDNAIKNEIQHCYVHKNIE